MSTFLFDKIIFGPVYSRRLGNSLGINLLPIDEKVCTFSCIYCECGPTDAQSSKEWVDIETFDNALASKLSEMQSRKNVPDSITFAGNGEPTLHPEFHTIMDITIKNRNIFFPDAKVAVLSNSTTVSNKNVFDALKRADLNILKLDVGSETLFKFINNPLINISLAQIVEHLSKFDGNLIVQTIFVRGSVNDIYFDNTIKEEIELYIEHLKRIRPHTIMLYPISRDTPHNTIEKISFREIEEISLKIKKVFPDIKMLIYS